jgi:uncharacterized lipoprotein YmbA
MFKPIRFVCFGGAAIALSACSVPGFQYSEALGLQPAQQAVTPAQPAAPVRVAAPASANAPTPAAQQQDTEEVEVATTSRWAHRRIGGSANVSDGTSGGLSDSDETGGWGG